MTGTSYSSIWTRTWYQKTPEKILPHPFVEIYIYPWHECWQSNSSTVHFNESILWRGKITRRRLQIFRQLYTLLGDKSWEGSVWGLLLYANPIEALKGWVACYGVGYTFRAVITRFTLCLSQLATGSSFQLQMSWQQSCYWWNWSIATCSVQLALGWFVMNQRQKCPRGRNTFSCFYVAWGQKECTITASNAWNCIARY